MKKILLLLLILSARIYASDPVVPLYARSPEVKGQKIHAAYVQANHDPIPLQVIEKEPPPAVDEVIPPKPGPNAIWIKGYWVWNRVINNYYWVCGVWRVPPPGHIWIPEQYLSVDSGWVFVRGIWVKNPLNNNEKSIITKTVPPAPQNETTGDAPGPDYFWSMGYWQYLTESNQFQWLSGSWQKYNSSYILEPAQWVLRPEGYLFCHSYWDFTIDKRGMAYDCHTQKPLNVQFIVYQISSFYPDYCHICCHYNHFEPAIWTDCGCIPPWWGWQEWWSLPTTGQWWLWWWWLHEGYPVPPFLAKEAIIMFPIPDGAVIKMFNNIKPPFFITPGGVGGIQLWIDAINKKLGGDYTLMPYIHENEIKALTDIVDDELPKTSNDRPGGKFNGKPIRKPGSIHSVNSGGKAQVPQLPSDSELEPQQAPAPVPPPPVAPEPTIIVTPPPVYHQVPVRIIDTWDNWDNDGRRPGHGHNDHDWDGHHGKDHDWNDRPGKDHDWNNKDWNKDKDHHNGDKWDGKGRGDGNRGDSQNQGNKVHGDNWDDAMGRGQNNNGFGQGQGQPKMNGNNPNNGSQPNVNGGQMKIQQQSGINQQPKEQPQQQPQQQIKQMQPQMQGQGQGQKMMNQGQNQMQNQKPNSNPNMNRDKQFNRGNM